MLASGTRNAREISGWSRGSSSSACGRLDLLAIDPSGPARIPKAVRVVGIVEGRGHEQATGVLDRVGRDLAHDAVLRDALLGRARVLDHVPASRVEQAVKPAAGPHPEIRPVDEDHVESPERCVPGHPGAGRPAPDHQHVSGEIAHRLNLAQPHRGRCRVRDLCGTEPDNGDGVDGDYSAQSNVRSTAFFQRWKALSRSAASICGSQRLSSIQFSRRSSISAQNPVARPAA